MCRDRAGRYAERSGGGLGIEIEEDPQGYHLALPRRQPTYCSGDPLVRPRCGMIRACRVVAVTVAVPGDFTPSATPPRHVRVQCGTHDPGARSRMTADLPPGRPCPGEGLRYQILGQRQIADRGVHRTQAAVARLLVELCEPFR